MFFSVSTISWVLLIWRKPRKNPKRQPTVKKQPTVKEERQVNISRPRGKAPRGKTWDSNIGEWVDEDSDDTSFVVTTKKAKVNSNSKKWPRPPGRAPTLEYGCQIKWDYDVGDWREVDSDDNDVCFGSKRSLPLPSSSTKPKRAAAKIASSQGKHHRINITELDNDDDDDSTD